MGLRIAGDVHIYKNVGLDEEEDGRSSLFPP